ncbi:MAG: putative DNA binding domain-containing protein [Firmicutes bacterium]|nr:putative DNA binding domain-containing protein [Bacillota bacterium]
MDIAGLLIAYDIKRLPDDDIVEVVVAFANTDGGDFYLGIEDDGEITGLHKTHKDITQLAAFIANKTVPPIAVKTEKFLNSGEDYILISVPKSRSIVAATNGKILRRRLKADGTPENIPMYPNEINTRLSSLSLLDFSSLPVPDAGYSDLDGTEREKLRNIIRNYRGEAYLLELNDEELDKALQFVKDVGEEMIPTYCGMLMIGKKERLKTLMPTAESSFQVLDGTKVVVNDTFFLPIISSFEKIEAYMEARNPEIEYEEGLFRISVPNFDKRAFREAIVNAYSHRDYTMLGMVRVLLDDQGLTISNPGGFIEGVTLNNLLTAEPHGRNPALADALKRIGLAERTGRGIDRIFEGSLIYGRPLPDYSETTQTTVKLFIPKSLPDKAFINMILEEQKKSGGTIPINSLFVLNELKQNRRMSAKELADSTNITETRMRQTLETLVESGLVERMGTNANAKYILSSKVYKESDNTIGYVRQTGVDTVRYPEMMLKFAKKNGGRITRAEAAELCRIEPSQAYRILKKLSDENKLNLVGTGKNAHYELV